MGAGQKKGSGFREPFDGGWGRVTPTTSDLAAEGGDLSFLLGLSWFWAWLKDATSVALLVVQAEGASVRGTFATRGISAAVASDGLLVSILRFLSSDKDFESSGKILSRKEVSEGVNLISSRFIGLTAMGVGVEEVEEDEGVTDAAELEGKEEEATDF